MNLKEKIEFWAQIGPIIAVGIAIVTVGISIVTVLQAQDSIESTNKLIQNTNKTLTSLNQLVEGNTRQLEILEEGLKTAKDEPILSAYQNLGKISLKFQCGMTNEESFLSLKPIIRDEKDVQTIVPIELHLFFNIHGKSSNSSEKYTVITEWAKPLNEAYHHNPQKNEPNVLLLMTKYFEMAEVKNYDHLKVDIFYAYVPYAPNTSYTLSNLEFELEPQFLAEFKKVDNEWILDTSQSTLCHFFD